MSDALGRRRTVIVAGHKADTGTARAGLTDEDADVRAAALGALHRMGQLTAADFIAATQDHAVAVRRRAATVAATFSDGSIADLLRDASSSVVEVACWSAGERPLDEADFTALTRIAVDHEDALCRESAVAALGALGDDRGLPAILKGCSDKPAVRRRAVLALAPFEGDEVDAALERALEDRDWQVRQAAEDLGAEASDG